MRADLIPTTLDGSLTRVIQECEEVIKEVTKLQTFGETATDPVTGIYYDNVKALLLEFRDLHHAIARVEEYYHHYGTSMGQFLDLPDLPEIPIERPRQNI